MAKVYVASSWSNEYQPRIVAFLREREHEVYDFRNPERKTDFRWSQISGNWEKMETDEYLDALEHPLVEAEFRSDFDAMRRADICVLVLPCGASAHSEAGWMKGTGKKVIVYQNRSQRPELMYKLFDGIFPTVADVTRFLKEFDRLNNLKLYDMEELWNKLGAWGYAVPILMLLCLNILLFTDIFEKIIIRCWGYLENIIEKTKRKKY